MCPPSFVILYASLAAALVALATLAIASHLGYRRYQYHIKVWFYSQGMHWLKKDYDCPGQFDIYLAFDDNDTDFVKQHILPGFEKLKTEGYSIYFPQKNSIAGDFKFRQDTEMASSSKRIIFLLSQNYINNGEAMALFRAMHAMCLKEQMYRIILVFLNKIPELSDVELKTAMEATKCLHYGEKLFWDSIRFRMPPLPKNSCEKEALEEQYGDNDNTPLLRGEIESHCKDTSNYVHQVPMIRKTAFVLGDRNTHVKHPKGEKVSEKIKFLLASTNSKSCDSSNKEEDDDMLLLLDEPDDGSQHGDSLMVYEPTPGQNTYPKGRNKDFNNSRLLLLDEPGSQSTTTHKNPPMTAVRPNPFLGDNQIVLSSNQQRLGGRSNDVAKYTPLLLLAEPVSKSQDRNQNVQQSSQFKNDFPTNVRNPHIKQKEQNISERNGEGNDQGVQVSMLHEKDFVGDDKTPLRSPKEQNTEKEINGTALHTDKPRFKYQDSNRGVKVLPPFPPNVHLNDVSQKLIRIA